MLKRIEKKCHDNLQEFLTTSVNNERLHPQPICTIQPCLPMATPKPPLEKITAVDPVVTKKEYLLEKGKKVSKMNLWGVSIPSSSLVRNSASRRAWVKVKLN